MMVMIRGEKIMMAIIIRKRNHDSHDFSRARCGPPTQTHEHISYRVYFFTVPPQKVLSVRLHSKLDQKSVRIYLPAGT